MIRESKSQDNNEKLFYRLKNKPKEYSIRKADSKMECPFCGLAVNNLQLRFSRKEECGEKVDMNHFSNRFEAYRKEMNKIGERKRKAKQKEKDPATFNLNLKERVKKAQQKHKKADPESFNLSNNKAAKKSQMKRKWMIQNLSI
jgi:hypothetical protein